MDPPSSFRKSFGEFQIEDSIWDLRICKLSSEKISIMKEMEKRVIKSPNQSETDMSKTIQKKKGR
jgi:hypothetical protein